MHVLLVAADGPDPAALAAHLATCWNGGSALSQVDPMVLPAARPPSPPGPSSQPTGVFVPTTALGLSSVQPEPDRPEVTLLRERCATADLVVVHVGVLDGGALHEGPVAEAARCAAPHAVPVVVLAGRSEVSRREQATGGVAGVHVVGDPVEPEAVARAARTWVPSWGS